MPDRNGSLVFKSGSTEQKVNVMIGILSAKDQFWTYGQQRFSFASPSEVQTRSVRPEYNFDMIVLSHSHTYRCFRTYCFFSHISFLLHSKVSRFWSRCKCCLRRKLKRNYSFISVNAVSTWPQMVNNHLLNARDV